MKPAFQFLIVHGDGSRVARLSVPRWLVYGSLSLLALAVTTIAGLSGEFALLLRQSSQMTALRQEAGSQRALIDLHRQRAATVRKEIDAWKALHARMWEAYGPERDLAARDSGVGGPREPETPMEAAGTAAEHGDDLDLLATSVAEEGPRVRELEGVISKYARIMATLPLSWPARGPVNSEFGVRKDPWDGAKAHHRGIDIGVPYGAPVRAPASGGVIVSGSYGDYGNCVMLDHGNGVRSLYGHLSKVLVHTGDRAEKGSVIGLAGSTGRSTGTHLHYAVYVKDRPVNPRSFLWAAN